MNARYYNILGCCNFRISCSDSINFEKFNPVYSLFFGAIVGCLIGGASLSDTVAVLLNGTQSIMGTAIRVLAAGMLAGVMMESGAAESIANAIVQKLGEKKLFYLWHYPQW